MSRLIAVCVRRSHREALASRRLCVAAYTLARLVRQPRALIAASAFDTAYGYEG